MRKFYLLSFICLLSFVSNAQLNKGKYILGGSVGVNYHAQKIGGYNFHTIDFSVSPEFGRFYKNNRMAGIGLTTSISNPDSSNTIYYYGAKVFLRQYFPLGKSFYFLAEEGIRADHSEYDRNQAVVKYTIARIYINPALAYAVTSRFLINVTLDPLAALTYTRNHVKNETDPNQVVDYTDTNITLAGNTESAYFSNLAVGVRWLL